MGRRESWIEQSSENPSRVKTLKENPSLTLALEGAGKNLAVLGGRWTAILTKDRKNVQKRQNGNAERCSKNRFRAVRRRATRESHCLSVESGANQFHGGTSFRKVRKKKNWSGRPACLKLRTLTKKKELKRMTRGRPMRWHV